MVSIEDARLVLGTTAGTISDEQISGFLIRMNSMANSMLDRFEQQTFGTVVREFVDKLQSYGPK